MPPDAFELLNGRLDRIQTDVEEIKRYMRDHPLCPSPGMCAILKEQVDKMVSHSDKQDDRISKVEHQLRWIAGVGAGLVFLATLFSGTIQKIFGL